MKKLIFLICSLLYISLSSQWIKLGLDKKNVTSISTNEITPTIFAVADGQLYKSSDHGESWELKVVDGANIIYYVQVDKITESLYLGTSKGIYKSIDNGTDFTAINNGLPNNFGIYPAVNRILVTENELIIDVSNNIYKTNKE